MNTDEEVLNYINKKVIDFLNSNKIEYSKDTNTLDITSRDASVFCIMPSLLVYPKDKFEISDILKFINNLKKIISEIDIVHVSKNELDNIDIFLNVSVQAGATCMSGGSLNSGIILDLKKHFKKISKVQKDDEENNFVDVETGVYFRDIERAVNKKNLMFAPYTSSKNICGIGGMLGNNASGEESLRHGATIDNVTELEVVLANGEIKIFKSKIINQNLDFLEKDILALYIENIIDIKREIGDVVKASSGYRLEKIVERNVATKDLEVNLSKIMIGAQGTLGVITRAKLKLVPKTKNQKVNIISLQDLSLLPEILQKLSKINAECVEVFDINTFKRAKKILPKETSDINKFFEKGEQLVIILQTDGYSESLDIGVEVSSGIAESVWAVRRSAYGVFRDIHESGMRAVPSIEDIIVPIYNFDKLIPALMEILEKYNIEYGFHGHIGDGALRIIPLFDFTDTEVDEKIINLTREVFSLVKELKGNICADHGDGIVRSPFLTEFYSESVINCFKQIKNIFDPYNILNNKKKTYFLFDNFKSSLDVQFKRQIKNNMKVNTQYIAKFGGEVKTGKFYQTSKSELMERLEQAMNGK